MKLDDDLDSILIEINDWRRIFLRKCKEHNTLRAKVNILKNDLRISKDSEKQLQAHLNWKQENINQLQGIFNEEREKNLKLQEENRKQKEEIQKHDEDKEKWDKEKIHLIEKQENELRAIKDSANEEVLQLKLNITDLKESNAESIESLKEAMRKNDEEHKRIKKLTISNYENLLSRLKRDLSNVHTELKILRERYATSTNTSRPV